MERFKFDSIYIYIYISKYFIAYSLLIVFFHFFLPPKVKAPKPPAFNNNSHKVAFELLTSERTYVERLHLLSAVSILLFVHPLYLWSNKYEIIFVQDTSNE